MYGRKRNFLKTDKRSRKHRTDATTRVDTGDSIAWHSNPTPHRRRQPGCRANRTRRARAVGFGLAGFVVTVALTFLGLLAITFFIGRVVPIDPVLAVGRRPRARKAVYEAARKCRWASTSRCSVQFVNYVGDVLPGDLGHSVSTGRPVADDLKRVFPATLEMATIGIIIGVLLGVPMGVYAASRQGSLVDQVIRVVGLLGYSVPAFWLGLVGLAVFYARLRWVGGPGRARHLL